MAKDGLLFPFFADVNKRTGAPIFGTLLTGVVTALIAFFTPEDTLADAISIGTLSAFSVVDAGVIILRYRSKQHPHRATILTVLFSLLIMMASFLYVYLKTQVGYSLAAGLAGLAMLPGGLLFFEKTVSIPKTFVCPWVPLLPLLGIAVNIFMLTGLQPYAWARLGGWTFIGVLIYFFYGISHSRMRINQKLNDIN